MTELTSTPAEWARVARSKWQHYADNVRDSDNAPAASLHEHSLAGMVPHLADAIDAAPREALQRLHGKVRARMAANADRESKARNDGRDGDALLNAARVDAFDWVLQRIDEELER